MKRFDLALILIGTAVAMSPALAAPSTMPGMGNMDGGGMGGKSAAASATQGFMAHGTINSINAAAGTVNITHQAIKALGWPGMTMTFAVRDKSMLAEVRAGNAVNFDLAKDPSGQYVVTRMTAAK